MHRIPWHLSYLPGWESVCQCLEKRCREILKQSWKICSVVYVPAVALQTKYTLPKKLLKNLWSKPKTHVLSTSRKHTARFLVKNCGECCGSTVLTVACYTDCQFIVFPLRNCVRINGVNSWSFTVFVWRQGCVLSPLLFIFYMNWIDNNSRVNESVIVESCRINRLLFANDLLLLVSSEQGLQNALDRFSAACNQWEWKLTLKSEKFDAIYHSRKPVQCKLQVSGNALKLVVMFKYFGVVFTSDGWWNKEMVRGLVKQM